MTEPTLSQSGTYVRKGLYSVQDVLSQCIEPTMGMKRKSPETTKDMGGDLIYMDSDRYWCFKQKGIHCYECGIEGRFFAKERMKTKVVPKPERFHFNLYGVDENGEEVLMTKDHVLPVAQGGPNHISNYRTMCSRCNCEKGNMNDNQYQIYKAIKNIMTQKETEELASIHADVVATIKILQERMILAGKPKSAFNQDDQYKTMCIMATAVRRIMDARSGLKLKGKQNIWRAPNLRLT